MLSFHSSKLGKSAVKDAATFPANKCMGVFIDSKKTALWRL